MLMRAINFFENKSEKLRLSRISKFFHNAIIRFWYELNMLRLTPSLQDYLKDSNFNYRSNGVKIYNTATFIDLISVGLS